MFGNMPGGDSNPIQSVMKQLQGGIRKGARSGRKNRDYLIRLENQAKMYGYQSDLKKSEIGKQGEESRLTVKTKGSEERRTVGKKAREGRADTTHGTNEAIRFHGATGAGAPSRMKTTNYDVGFNAPKNTKSKTTKTTNIVNANVGSAGQTVPTLTTPQTPAAVTVPGAPTNTNVGTPKKTTTTPKGTKKAKSGAGASTPVQPSP
jgi:hypothetical protein